MSVEQTNEIEAAASDWLIRRESGRWTQADQVRFEEWLDASTLNRVAFLRLELAWEESARLQALGAGKPGHQPPATGEWNLTPFFEPSRATAAADGQRRAARSRARRLAVAATVMFGVAASFATYRFWSADDAYRTPIGGLASIPMSDGSKVTLNTDSEIRIAVDEKERRIDLRAGEAFFDVAKDPSRPFVVEAGKKRIVAVGTKFSVRREDESVEVIVTEGEVRVEAGTQTGQGAETPVRLLAGAIAHADGAGVLIQRKTLPEAEAHLSWRNGVLVFRDQNLADAVAEFNRYNERKVVIADPAVGALKIEGNFRATNVEAFVRLLESGFPVRALAEDEQIVLTAK